MGASIRAQVLEHDRRLGNKASVQLELSVTALLLGDSKGALEWFAEVRGIWPAGAGRGRLPTHLDPAC